MPVKATASYMNKTGALTGPADVIKEEIFNVLPIHVDTFDRLGSITLRLNRPPEGTKQVLIVLEEPNAEDNMEVRA